MEEDRQKIARATDDQAWSGCQTVYGYQFQLWLGKYRFHIFLRGDPGEAMHDHPWDFWTYPLTPYVEEVLDLPTDLLIYQVVPAFQWSFRKASHTHRVLGRWSGRYDASRRPLVMDGNVVTFVQTGIGGRIWHYVSLKNGKVHRLPWRPYLKRVDKDMK